MLVLKKMSVKKLVVYSLIVAAMLGGIGFMLYQNKTLTNQNPTTVGALTQPGQIIMDGDNVTDDQAALNDSLADLSQAETGLDQVPVIDQVKNNQAIDLTIFSKQRFKDLKENFLIPQDNSALGKQDPFSPK